MTYSIDILNTKKPLASKLTALYFCETHRQPNGKTERIVLCECECGVKKQMTVKNFLHQNTSCGCIQNIICPGLSGAKKSIYPLKLRKAYHDMIYRCDNNKWYSDVVVCEEWRINKISFLKWAIDNGYKDGLQLDKDIIGNGKLYSPETCCFVTPKQNNRARRNLKKYLYKGKYLLLSEISDITGIDIKIIFQRLKSKWTIENAADTTTPKFEWNSFLKKLQSIPIPDMQTDEFKSKVSIFNKKLSEIIEL